MKLRFRGNTLRLRVNQREVASLADGRSLEEAIAFPNDARFVYLFEPNAEGERGAAFEHGRIRIQAPLQDVRAWAQGDAVGLYFDLPAGATTLLRIAIEKDLECVDGPPEEYDPYAFPRSAKNC